MVNWRAAARRSAFAVIVASAAAAGLSAPSWAAGSPASPGGTAPRAAAVSSPFISAPPDVVVGEADGFVDLPVTLSAPGQGTVYMYYSTLNVTASGADAADPCPAYTYQPIQGTLTFPPGTTSQTLRVNLNNCGISSPAGFLSFDLLIYSAVGGTIARAETQVDITGDTDTGATPALRVRDAVTGNNASTVTVPVVLGGPSGLASKSPVTVSYATHNASAVAGTDYTATSGTLTFPPGATAKNITVPIKARAGRVPTRSFSVTLSSPHNATIGDGTGVVTIEATGGTAVSSPDIATPPDVVAGEAEGYIDLPVTLSAPAQGTVYMYYTTRNGTATGTLNNGDPTPCPTFQYMGFEGTLTFPPGATTQVVRIPLNNCGLASPGYFSLGIYSAVGGVITRPSTNITLVENPTAPGAPTAVTATAGNRQAVVTFAAPASDGGDPVNFYTVTTGPGGAKFSSASSPITVTGLTNGTAYTFRVTATNAFATGPASAASKAVVPATVPGAPTKVTAARVAAGQIKVSFVPGANNGSPVTSYTATCTSANGGVTRAKSGAASPLTVTGLTAGKSYTCAAYATNARGNGPAAKAPSAVTA